MGAEWQNRRHVDPNWYVGKGKAEELARRRSETGFDILVADDELSPAQQKSLESLLNVKVIDRSRLILDIFALHAQTHEGRLQVELAQLEYQLPRLTRLWTHLSRTQGGIGSRGPGESQLETDRRIIRERIKKMKERVEDVRRQRETTARGRDRRLYPTVAIVGYTNAGKSTLLNALVGSEVAKAEDKLFATLDPTSRQVKLGDGQTAIVTDTVGFIHKLPHQLVDAFRATLEEVTRADVLVEVVDAVGRPRAEHRATVQTVLDELGRRRQAAPGRVQQGRPPVPGRRRVEAGAGGERARSSCRRRPGFGLDTLRAEIAALLASLWEDVDVAVPYAAGELLARVRERGTVDLEYGDRDVRVTGRMAPGLAGELRSAAERWEASLAAEGVALLSDADGRRVRPAGRARAGRRPATGSGGPSPKGGAAGAGARRSSASGGLRHSLLLETAPGRRVQPPRARDAGRAADAAPRGRRDAPRQRDRGGRDPARRRARPGTRAAWSTSRGRRSPVRACARLLAGRGRAGRVGATDPAPRHRRAADHDGAGAGRADRRRDVADRRRPAVPRRTTTGCPLLADAEAWPLEQAEQATDSAVNLGIGARSWTRCGQDRCGRLRTRKLVDNAVVAPAACPVWFVLPEGAAELKTEPTVLASTETGSGRKFLRAFCCPRTGRRNRPAARRWG